MPVQRKIFRVEEMMRDEPQPQDLLAPDAPDFPSPGFPSNVIDELRALRTLMERRMPDAGETRAKADAPAQEVRKLKIELDVIGNAIKQTRTEIVSLQDQGFDSGRVSRVTKELDAVFEDTSRSTDRILKAAEDIDRSAHALAGMLKGDHELGLAHDIQERVTEIFEACNFHDLTGQRISKVAAMLKMVEEHLARMMEIWSVIERFNVDAAQTAASELDGLLNGPKLAGDNGHSTQDEIDRLFN
ncbi:protein phosphatase CheZ [Pseudorhodoplanes sp.]|uniref:protein phosphatase CheZ n=1 Tax=Pseudorhodoplanes sp. TaxID=1934341 RepID=UPI002CEF2378|nr:protein phosphatase CheZ [Pseudorhodoplanes sp.]HWV54937.1 protein phosphatase CheZ [Pseudorhodoplanes sp.]